MRLPTYCNCLVKCGAHPLRLPQCRANAGSDPYNTAPPVDPWRRERTKVDRTGQYPKLRVVK